MKSWGSSISPSDAVVALRSFPRRWRGLLAQVGDEDDPDGVLRRRPPDGSASIHDALVDTVAPLARADEELRGIVPEGAPPVGTRTGAGGSGVDALAAVAEALADRVGRVPNDQWDRTGASGTTALDVVRAAVVTASENLRQAERTLAQVKGRPG